MRTEYNDVWVKTVIDRAAIEMRRRGLRIIIRDVDVGVAVDRCKLDADLIDLVIINSEDEVIRITWLDEFSDGHALG